jgi:PhzF family phenazine biosynthesis protein
MRVPLYIVDAFTDQPFRGNPAAVCMLSGAADGTWMQNMAREMNLSETAFLHPEGDGYRLRWFTPAVEVALCGHATLASAHVLWETNRLPFTDLAKFYTQSGVLAAERRANEIELSFPAKPAEAAPAPDGLLAALGVEAEYVGRTSFDYLVQIESAERLRSLKPDFRKLATLPVRGVIVTSRSDEPRYDFISRFFAPASGVDEDPVTGSAHCTLGPFWKTRLNKAEFSAYQASPRGGIVKVRVTENRVFLAGQAVTVVRGELA